MLTVPMVPCVDALGRGVMVNSNGWLLKAQVMKVTSSAPPFVAQLNSPRIYGALHKINDGKEGNNQQAGLKIPCFPAEIFY